MDNNEVPEIYCRICGSTHLLSKALEFYDLFDGNVKGQQMNEIRRELLLSWNLSVCKEDKDSHHICNWCFNEFVLYFLFRKNCLDAQERLKSVKQMPIQIQNRIKNLNVTAHLTTLITKKLIEHPDEIKDADDLIVKFVQLEDPSERKQIQEEIEDESKTTTANEESNATVVNENPTPSPSIISYASDDNIDYSDNWYETPQIKKKVYKKDNRRIPTFVCRFCYFDPDAENVTRFTSDNQNALDEHIRTTHSSVLPYNCPYANQGCEKIYKSAHSRNAHVKYGHKQPHTLCETCGKPLTRSAARNHNARYHAIGDYTCETCGISFTNISLSAFQYHQRWHQPDLQFKCEICGRIFLQRTHFREHMTHHTKKFKIKCDICGKGFISSYELKSHNYRIHGAEAPLKCNFCEKRFVLHTDRTKHQYHLHNYVANSRQTMKCDKCQMAFYTMRLFENHKCEGKSTAKLECKICNRYCYTERGLKKHLHLHSSVDGSFRCDICYLKFTTELGLSIHRSLKHRIKAPKKKRIRNRRKVSQSRVVEEVQETVIDEPTENAVDEYEMEDCIDFITEEIDVDDASTQYESFPAQNTAFKLM